MTLIFRVATYVHNYYVLPNNCLFKGQSLRMRKTQATIDSGLGSSTGTRPLGT